MLKAQSEPGEHLDKILEGKMSLRFDLAGRISAFIVRINGQLSGYKNPSIRLYRM